MTQAAAHVIIAAFFLQMAWVYYQQTRAHNEAMAELDAINNTGSDQ